MTYIAELKPGDWIDVLRMNEVDPFEDRYWVKTVRRDGPRGIRYGLTKSRTTHQSIQDTLTTLTYTIPI